MPVLVKCAEKLSNNVCVTLGANLGEVGNIVVFTVRAPLHRVNILILAGEKFLASCASEAIYNFRRVVERQRRID